MKNKSQKESNFKVFGLVSLLLTMPMIAMDDFGKDSLPALNFDSSQTGAVDKATDLSALGLFSAGSLQESVDVESLVKILQVPEHCTLKKYAPIVLGGLLAEKSYGTDADTLNVPKNLALTIPELGFLFPSSSQAAAQEDKSKSCMLGKKFQLTYPTATDYFFTLPKNEKK